MSVEIACDTSRMGIFSTYVILENSLNAGDQKIIRLGVEVLRVLLLVCCRFLTFLLILLQVVSSIGVKSGDSTFGIREKITAGAVLFMFCVFWSDKQAESVFVVKVDSSSTLSSPTVAAVPELLAGLGSDVTMPADITDRIIHLPHTYFSHLYRCVGARSAAVRVNSISLQEPLVCHLQHVVRDPRVCGAWLFCSI